MRRRCHRCRRRCQRLRAKRSPSGRRMNAIGWESRRRSGVGKPLRVEWSRLTGRKRAASYEIDR